MVIPSKHPVERIMRRLRRLVRALLLPMAKNRFSKAWLDQHRNDPYVKQAQARGYRSRAAFKLIEIDQQDKLIQPGG